MILIIKLRQTTSAVRNFDHYLATYLYKHKQLSLTGIGIFTLQESYVLPEHTDNAFFYPEDVIEFKFDRSQNISQDFIDEMAGVTGKSKALTNADIDQYLEHVRQYINLGRPYIMRPLGSLQKNNTGSYYFTPGAVGVEKVDSSFGIDSHRTFNTKPSAEMRKRKSVVNFIVLAIVLCLLGGGAWLAYTFLNGKNANAEADVVLPLPAADTNTIVAQGDTGTKAATLIANDTLRFKAIFERTKWRKKAFDRLGVTRLRGLPTNIDSVRVNDTLTRYRLFIYKRFTAADTAVQRALLSKSFATNVVLEKE